MRLIKNLEKDKTSEFLSATIDSVVLELGYDFFDRLEFKTGKDGVEFREGTVEISIDKNNRFLAERDVRATRILILQQLELARLKKNKILPDYIEKLVVNRRLAKKFSRDFFYLSYLLLIREKREIDDMNKFLDINLLWLSFYGIDEYNSRFLFKMLNMFKYRKAFQEQTRKLFLVLKKDLEEEANLTKAVNEFRAMK
jgi:hypothetical protein